MQSRSSSNLRAFATDFAELRATGRHHGLLMLAPALACAALASVALLGLLWA